MSDEHYRHLPRGHDRTAMRHQFFVDRLRAQREQEKGIDHRIIGGTPFNRGKEAQPGEAEQDAGVSETEGLPGAA